MASPRFGLSQSSGRGKLKGPLSDETIWKRLTESGFDEDSIRRRDKAGLIAYIAKLEAEEGIRPLWECVTSEGFELTRVTLVDIKGQVGIDSLSEIDEIFDDIIYNKGASILRMMQTYLGGQVFQDFSGCDCGKADIGKHLGQIENGNRNATNTCPWIKVNVGQTGFYRVKYHEALVARLKFAAEKMYLSTPDRFGILDDMYALSTAQQLPLSSLLTYMSAYSGECDQTVLNNMITISHAVVNITADAAPEFLECTKEFLTNFIQNFAKRLGWMPKPGESDLETALRVKVLVSLAVFGHGATLEEARRRFHLFLNYRQTPLFPTDIRQAAYVAVMQTANPSSRNDYDSLLGLLHETNKSTEKRMILSSMISCPDPEIVLEVLNYIISSENKALLPALSVSFGARDAAWTWLKSNWDYLLKTFDSKIAKFVSKTVETYASHEKANEVKKFFANRTIQSIAESLNWSIEQIQANAMWTKSIQQDKNQMAEVLWSCHSTSVKPQRPELSSKFLNK